MEISGKSLREVEFRDRLRGYDTDEVDEFLEKVAIAVDEMQAELARLSSRGAAPARPVEEPPVFDDDSIRRTLVLAQRTADLAVSEAREEADRLLEAARAQSETVLAQAHEAVRRLRDDAEQELHERVRRLELERERLEREAGALAALLEGERARLTDSLTTALRFVEDSLAVPADLARAADSRRGSELAGAGRPGELTSGLARDDGIAGGGIGGGGIAGGEVADDDGADDEGPIVDVARPRDDVAPFAPPPFEIPDVEAEIDADAATAVRPDPSPGSARASEGSPRLDWPPSASSSVPALDADEALLARWASGGSIDGPPATRDGPDADNMLRFDRSPGGRPAS